MHLYCHAAKSNQLCKQQRSRCSINSCKIISRHGCVQEPSTLASTAKPVQRYRVEIPSIPHICICCHQWISIIPSGEMRILFLFLSPLMVALARWEWLPPSQLMLYGDRAGHRGTISFHSRLLSHIHTELDWCSTCAPPALLCCSTVSHISVWKNGQRSGE